MLVGKRWDEETVLRAAHAFEQTGTYNVEEAGAAASR
jgi:Asp-tRNA(Asn)/Glu-tRNA(Gln) amidotransferase A subunit family amidase